MPATAARGFACMLALALALILSAQTATAQNASIAVVHDLVARETAAQRTAPAGSVQQASAPAAAQPSARAFFKDVLLDQRAIWLSPFTASGSDAKWLVSVGLTTAALIGTDKEITTNIDTSGNRQRNWGRVSEIGSGYALAGTAAAFYLTGRLTHNERARATGLLSAEALVDELIVVSALKEATNRVRPSTDNGRQDFYDGGSAFPSGHTAATWAVAAVVAEQYRDKPAVGWTAYGLASLVGVARVMALKHSPSDVFVGGVIGYLIGRHVVRRAAGDHGRTSVLVTPYVDPRTHGFGVAGSLSF